jgi:hypothetical protein
MTFKVTVIQEDNYAVSYEKSVVDDCVFTSSADVTGAASFIVYPNDNRKFYVAETIDDLIASKNGEPEITIKNYYALLSQSATDAPVAYLLNNSDRDYLGDIVWTRTAPNVYRGTLTGAFPDYCTFMQPVQQNDGVMATVDFTTGQPDYVTITTTADGMLTKTPVEIKVFLNVMLP